MQSCIKKSIESVFSTVYLDRIETIPPQGVFHCVLIMGSHHYVGISVERNLIQHIVQASYKNTHRDVHKEGNLTLTVVFDTTENYCA